MKCNFFCFLLALALSFQPLWGQKTELAEDPFTLEQAKRLMQRLILSGNGFANLDWAFSFIGASRVQIPIQVMPGP